MRATKHELIREWIRGEIHRGRFLEGDQLPTEQVLMKQFGVSRAPVQQAMRALELNGEVVRRPGAGTFVSVWGLRTDGHSFLTAGDDRSGTHMSHQVLGTRVTGGGLIDWAGAVFGPQDPVALLSRLKVHTTGRPIMLEKAVISLTRAPAVLDQDLTELITADYYASIGLRVRRITTHLSAQLLEPEDAAHLQIDPSIPVIRQHRTVVGQDDEPYETSYFYMHPTNQLMEFTQNV